MLWNDSAISRYSDTIILIDVFGKRIISETATDRTAETINNAVADVNRCIEISTGGEITEEDKDNKQCPEIIKGKLNETTD